MIRSFALASVIAFGAIASSPAESFRLEGEAFKPNAPIDWSSTSNGLPESFVVFKVVPQQFSKEVISRVLEIADFKPVTMKLSADKKTMQWRWHDKQGTLTRSLDIAPAVGWINYFDTKTEETSSKPSVGVPTFEEGEKLAMDYLRQLGGDTNQLSLKPQWRTDTHRTLYNKKGGTAILEDVTIRGVMFCRQLDGIRLNGSSGRGGFAIDFGNHAKVARLVMIWRNLQPDKRYRTASAKEIISFIKAGRATLPEQQADVSSLSHAKKFTITKITPYYWGDIGGAEQKFAYPFAELEVKADFADGNNITFTLFCPILSDKIVEKKN